ncbi:MULTISPECIES: hypothetical protein [unclassified Mesorhizobium]|nr:MULTISPECIES: hypothetical protein [unclassified Mesorhizobium]
MSEATGFGKSQSVVFAETRCSCLCGQPHATFEKIDFLCNL